MCLLQCCLLPCRFIHDILYGVNIVVKGLAHNAEMIEKAVSRQDEAQAPATQESAAAAPPAAAPQLQLLLHASNVSVLLPASSS
jgi:hypothetical protein